MEQLHIGRPSVRLPKNYEHNLCYIPSAGQGGDYFFKDTIFTRGYLRQQELIIEEALKKIEPLKQTDNALYQKLKNRIDVEKPSYIYWQLTFWKDYFTKGQIAQKIDEFESICNAVGIYVGAFVPSQVGFRPPMYEGLPTVESHRKLDLHIAIEELKACGVNGIYFGDAYATNYKCTYSIFSKYHSHKF